MTCDIRVGDLVEKHFADHEDKTPQGTFGIIIKVLNSDTALKEVFGDTPYGEVLFPSTGARVRRLLTIYRNHSQKVRENESR